MAEEPSDRLTIEEEIQPPVAVVASRPTNWESCQSSEQSFNDQLPESKIIFTLIDTPYSATNPQACNAVITDVYTFLEMMKLNRFVDPNNGRRYVLVMIGEIGHPLDNQCYPDAVGPGHSNSPYTGMRRPIGEFPDYVFSDLCDAVQFVRKELRKVESIFILGSLQFVEYAVAQKFVHRVYIPSRVSEGIPKMMKSEWTEALLHMVDSRTGKAKPIELPFLVMERISRMQRLGHSVSLASTLMATTSGDTVEEYLRRRLLGSLVRQHYIDGKSMVGGGVHVHKCGDESKSMAKSKGRKSGRK